MTSRDNQESDDRLFAELEQLVVTDPPQALDTALAALEDVDARGIPADRLRIRRMLAMAYSHTSQFELALDVCNQALSLPDADQAPVDLARIRLASMQPLANLGRIEEAITAGETALASLRASGDRSLAGRAALNTGAIHAMTGHPESALPLFEQAREYLAGEPTLAGQIETNIGTALAALDRFEEAEAAFANASRLLDAGEMSWAAALAEGNLADLASRQGAINRGLRHFEAARRYLENDEAMGQLGRINAEEAGMLASIGLPTLARERFVDAIELLREHGTPAHLAAAQLAFGAVLVEMGDLDAATALVAETRSLFTPGEFPDLDHQLGRLSTELAISTGAWDLATKLVDTGLAKTAGRPIQHLRWSILRARLELAQGHTSEARALLEKALGQVEQAQITPLLAELHELLMEIAHEEGNQARALDHARAVIDATERVRGTIQADRLRQSWHRRRLGVYLDLYRALVGQPDPAAQHEAFNIAERIRGRMLFDAMNRLDDVEETGPIHPQDRPLVEALEGHRRWLNWTYSALAAGEEPSEERLAEIREREDIAHRLSDRLATLRPHSILDAPITLDTLQENMPDCDVILSYLVVDDALTLQVITADGVTGFDNLAPVDEVSRLAATLQFQLGRALAHGDRAISPSRVARLKRDTDVVLTQLYDLLIAPVVSLLEGHNRLVIIPSGDLHSVPFYALMHDGRYLIDDFTSTRAPGVSILVRMFNLRHKDGPSLDHPLVVGVPDDTAPGLGEEARFVANCLPGAKLLLDKEATTSAVLEAMPEADLIHLACHGQFQVDHPTASGLLLADDWLTLDDLDKVRLNHALVVLTGCETGRVRVEQGDDLVGFMAALIGSGAGGMVMSLWKTHDHAAMDLMTVFYESISRGSDYLTALREAILAARETFAHPAFWAPFTAVHIS